MFSYPVEYVPYFAFACVLYTNNIYLWLLLHISSTLGYHRALNFLQGLVIIAVKGLFYKIKHCKYYDTQDVC